jgi:hypothetical protein
MAAPTTEVAFDLLGQAEPLMKRYYDDRRVLSMAFKNRPLFAWIPKKTGVVGGSPYGNGMGGYQVPITIDDIAGESGDFGSAVTARDGNSHKVWTLNRIKRYATATIDWETVRAMRNNVGAFMDAIDPQIQSGINQISNTIAMGLYHPDGSGHRGQVASIASNVVTLTAATAHLARTWSLRRTLVADTVVSGGTLHTGSTKVTGVDVAAGKITVEDSAQINAATGLAANDYIFPLGDYTASGENPKFMDGLGTWGPAPAGITPASPAFKGVARADYKSKLLMLHATVANQTTAGDGSFVRGIRVAAATLQANEGNPDALFVSPARWAQIESDLASQSRYEMMMGSDGRTGFDSIVLNAAGGKIQVVSDPWCPPNTGYLLQQDTWELFSLDRVPDFVSDDGGRLHRLENADEVEFRLGGYFNVACRAPGYNMVLNFATS